MKTTILVMVWIFTIATLWIGLAYILAIWSVIGLPQDIFIHNLSHFIVIRSALFFGTIITAVVYFVDRRFQRLYRPS